MLVLPPVLISSLVVFAVTLCLSQLGSGGGAVFAVILVASKYPHPVPVASLLLLPQAIHSCRSSISTQSVDVLTMLSMTPFCLMGTLLGTHAEPGNAGHSFVLLVALSITLLCVGVKTCVKVFGNRPGVAFQRSVSSASARETSAILMEDPLTPVMEHSPAALVDYAERRWRRREICGIGALWLFSIAVSVGRLYIHPHVALGSSVAVYLVAWVVVRCTCGSARASLEVPFADTKLPQAYCLMAALLGGFMSGFMGVGGGTSVQELYRDPLGRSSSPHSSRRLQGVVYRDSSPDALASGCGSLSPFISPPPQWPRT
eukprot:GEMP01030379.1.p1 GENE.GEMP01030379.1~~GEMP01030379.1.p1  ORF type:complete len:316 (+),score=46.73 GEMP01030379.1:62-1009(+)